MKNNNVQSMNGISGMEKLSGRGVENEMKRDDECMTASSHLMRPEVLMQKDALPILTECNSEPSKAITPIEHGTVE